MNAYHRERGAALVETALILPFMLLLALGVVDISRAIIDAARVEEAVQEGAVYASLHPGAPEDAITRAEETIDSPDFTGSISVTCPASDEVTVTVSYTFNYVTPYIANLLGDSIDLTTSKTAKVLSTDVCVPSP